MKCTACSQPLNAHERSFLRVSVELDEARQWCRRMAAELKEHCYCTGDFKEKCDPCKLIEEYKLKQAVSK